MQEGQNTAKKNKGGGAASAILVAAAPAVSEQWLTPTSMLDVGMLEKKERRGDSRMPSCGCPMMPHVCSYDPYSYGLCSDGLYSYGPYSYGLVLAP